MSVHKAISEHSQRQHKAIRQFLELDAKRETLIEEALNRCRRKEAFSVEKINEVTREINELAQSEIVPVRKYVTVQMICDFVKTL